MPNEWLVPDWNPFRQGVGWQPCGHTPQGFWTVPNSDCYGCGHSIKHCTSREYVTANPPQGEIAENLVSVKDIRIAQYLLWRMGAIADGLLGWQPGFLINAEKSANFADFYQAKVDLVPNEPNRLILYSDAYDMTEVPIYLTWISVGIGRTLGPIYGCPQPGDIIEFVGNTVYSLNLKPMITKIIGVTQGNYSKKAVIVEVDADCSKLYNMKVHPWNEMGTVYAKCWREAGARPMFLESTMIPSELRGTKVCANCKWDPTQSVANYNVVGVAKLPEQNGLPERHYYCALRKWREYEVRYVGNDWVIVPIDRSPSGIENFSPLCSLEDCDCYTPIQDFAPFNPRLHFGFSLAQLIWPRDKGVMSPPGAQSHLDMVCKRLGNPSLCSLTDMWDWSGFGKFALGDLGPVDQQEAYKWQEHSGRLGWYETKTDGDGNQFIKKELGTFLKWVDDWSDGYGIGKLPDYADVEQLGNSPPLAFFGTIASKYWARSISSCHLERSFPPRLSHGYSPSNDLHALTDVRGISRTPVWRQMSLWIRVSSDTVENDHMKVEISGGTMRVTLKPLIDRDKEPSVRISRHIYARYTIPFEQRHKCNLYAVDLEPVWHTIPWLYEGNRMTDTVKFSPSPGAEVADYAQPVWYVDSANASFGHTGRAVRQGDALRNPNNPEQAVLVHQMIAFGGVVTNTNLPPNYQYSRLNLPSLSDFSRCDRCLFWSEQFPSWLNSIQDVEFVTGITTSKADYVTARFYRDGSDTLYWYMLPTGWPSLNVFEFQGIPLNPPFCLEILC